jgi:hypothetical protein
MYQHISTQSRIFYLALGAACGGIVGYLIADYIAVQLYNQQFEETPDYELAEKILKKILPDEDVVILKDEKKDSKEEDKRKRVDYSHYTKPSIETLVERYEEEDEPETPLNDQGILTLQDWENSENDKVTYLFYAEDSVFVDEKHDVIIDPNSLLGPNLHLHFGEHSEDPDVVYVRTETNDVEVLRLHDRYSPQQTPEIQNEPEEPPVKPKPKPKRMRRAAKPKPAPEVEDEEDDG